MHEDKPRLLYVEDNKATQEEMCDILSLYPLRLYTANNGAAGLEVFKQQVIDIVLSDLQMPKMNGLDMAQHILAISPKTPIILLTADNDQQLIAQAKQSGVNFFINKPVELSQLMEILESLELKLDLCESNI